MDNKNFIPENTAGDNAEQHQGQTPSPQTAEYPQSWDAQQTEVLPSAYDQAPQGSAAPQNSGVYGAPQFGEVAYQQTPQNQAYYGETAYPGQSFYAPSQNTKKRNNAMPFVLGIVLGALIGGLVGGGVAYLSQPDGGHSSMASGPVEVKGGDTKTTVNAVASAKTQGVVTIDVVNSKQQGSGSGVIISEDGYIVTNTHVVTLDGSAPASFVRVRLADGRLMEAKVIGTDPLADLAVIKIDAKNLPAIKLADSNSVQVGDLTVAIGAPLDLPSTVTTGVVSALNRGISVKSSAVPEDQSGGTSDDKSKPWKFDLGQGGQATGGSVSLPVIQTDASINPGNSGGALLNGNGDLIGINVAIASNGGSGESAGSVGLGFSIPSNLVKRVTDALIKGDKPSHGLLGATVSNAASTTKASHAGGIISEVVKGSAAEAAGLQKGDIITKVDGVDAADGTAVSALIRLHAGGETAQITYLRDGKERTASAKLGKVE